MGSHTLGWSQPGLSIPEKQGGGGGGPDRPGPTCGKQALRAPRASQVAQVLLTRGGLENRERFLNARHTLLRRCCGLGVMPGGERERHGGHRRDPLRRQRQPLGHGGEPGERGPAADPADRRGRLLPPNRPPTNGPSDPSARSWTWWSASSTARSRDGSQSGSEFRLRTRWHDHQARRRWPPRAARGGAATVIVQRPPAGTILTQVAAGEDGGHALHRRQASGQPQALAGLHRAAPRARSCWTTAPSGRCARSASRSLLPAGVVEHPRASFGIGDSVACVDRPRRRERARGLTAYSPRTRRGPDPGPGDR